MVDDFDRATLVSYWKNFKAGWTLELEQIPSDGTKWFLNSWFWAVHVFRRPRTESLGTILCRNPV